MSKFAKIVPKREVMVLQLRLSKSHLKLCQNEDNLLSHRLPAHLDENLFHESRSRLLISDFHNLCENTDCADEILFS
jgi:hypothetical protein